MTRHKKYTEAVIRINALRKALKNDPSNTELSRQIQQEEENLYSKELRKTDDELLQFFRLNGIEFGDDDED